MSTHELLRKPGTSAKQLCRTTARDTSGPPNQAALDFSEPGDELEIEADRVADQVMRAAPVTPSSGTLQRACARCEAGGEKKHADDKLQRKPVSGFVFRSRAAAPALPAPSARFRRGLAAKRAGGGEPLPAPLRGFMEGRFGADFGGVRVHRDAAASQLAEQVQAKAFTVGGDLFFGPGHFQPLSEHGKRLIAHELAHVVQQRQGMGSVQRQVLQREPKDAEGAPQAESTKDDADRPKGIVSMHFDGRDLIVKDGDREAFVFSGDSGRPVLLRPEDARECGADPVTDTYMNDKRFVGIRDNGPIPEGKYRFAPSGIQEFGFGERLRLLMAGHSKVQTEAGVVTGGDWGSGRVQLNPVGPLREGPCGNANKRSGFFLHGGILAGSSGCIDIGGGFSTLKDWLSEYRQPITLTVKYEHSPPSVGALSGFTGAIAYGRFGLGVEPSLGLGVESQGEQRRLLVRPQLDAVLRWAGGALRAGARLELPLDDRDAFLRLGLSGGADFRILGGLFGRLQLGHSFALSEGASAGTTLGGGLNFDFGGPQLGLVYDALLAAGADPDAHRTLVQLGFRF